MNDRIASAVFDSRDEAERALSELRSAAGISENSISIVGRSDETGTGSTGMGTETTGSVTDDHNEEAKSDVVKGGVIGAGTGAILGIAALAIPGVGPLAAAGAIAASAIPTGAAIGAGAGLAAGSIAGLLSNHGVDEGDSRYFEERISQGGYFDRRRRGPGWTFIRAGARNLAAQRRSQCQSAANEIDHPLTCR